MGLEIKENTGSYCLPVLLLILLLLLKLILGDVICDRLYLLRHFATWMFFTEQ